MKVLAIFGIYQKKYSNGLHQFNLYVLLICGKKLATIEIFLLNFFGDQKAWQNGNFCLYFLKESTHF